MKMQTTKIFLAAMLMMGSVGLLQLQPILSQPSRPDQLTAAKDTYQGSWKGTLEFVGSQGQILLFIDCAGKLYGSYESYDGKQFVQISGFHRGNVFHMILTTPPSSTGVGGSASEPYTFDATVKWEGANRFGFVDPAPIGHVQSYTFERKEKPSAQ